MADEHRKVTHRSFGERIGNSVSAALFGVCIFIGAFPLLFWNEGRAVQAMQSLAEGQDLTVSVTAERLVPANEGRLVHLSGHAFTGAPLLDPVFGVEVLDSLRLRRSVESYEWREVRSTRTTEQLGGGEGSETIYKYYPGWHREHLDSGSFRFPEGHYNPPPVYQDRNIVAADARLGAYRLPEALLEGLSGLEPLRPGQSLTELPRDFVLLDGVFYKGDPRAPEVGDERVSFAAVPEGEVTVVARQSGDGLAPFRTSQDQDIFFIYPGKLTAAEVFDLQREQVGITTWMLRGLGFAMMVFGLCLMVGPLSVLASILPFLGALVGRLFGLSALALAVPLWLGTIALAWIVYRPVIALLLIGLGLGVAALLFYLRHQRLAASGALPAKA